MSTILTGRTHARRVENARYAPRTDGGQFMPTVSPTSSYWKTRDQTAKASRPAEFTGATWNAFIDLLWPVDRFIPWQESATKVEKAVELWQAGERDLETLAAKVNEAIPA